MTRALSPVLLLGAGTGEATCGILYLASYLRAAASRPSSGSTTGTRSEDEVGRSLEGLVARVRPRLVGISLKWFHHVAPRAAHREDAAEDRPRASASSSAATPRRTGGGSWTPATASTTSCWATARCRCWRSAAATPSPPNCVTRDADGTPARLPLAYVQGATNSDDVYYSHFDDIFLSQLDLHAFSGWVAPGKGCGENCLYCGGARGNQKAAFGRAKPFLRSEESVRRDHQEIARGPGRCATTSRAARRSSWRAPGRASTSRATPARTSCGACRRRSSSTRWPGPSSASTWCSTSAASPSSSGRSRCAAGCSSRARRTASCWRSSTRCRRHPNLDVEISGIAGLPFASEATLEEERRLVERVIGLDCVVGYQRLEAQPGALVTEHPARFDMVTEARTFTEFLDYFERREPGE